MKSKLVLLLLPISYIIYNDKKFGVNSQILVLLIILLLLYKLLNHIPNFEYFKAYDIDNKILDEYQEDIAMEEDQIHENVISNNNILKYGNIIILKTVSSENKYLTGGRHGNMLPKTNNLNEFVYCTNENRYFKWKLRSNLGNGDLSYPDPKENQAVKFGDHIYLQTLTIEDRFLVGGIGINNLPYSYSNNEGVATLSKNNEDSSDKFKWIIKSDLGSGALNEGDNKMTKIVSYGDKILLQSNSTNDRFLSGGRGSYALDNASEDNQQVYSVSSKDVDYGIFWIIKKNKNDPENPLIECNKNSFIKWPRWEYEPGMIGKQNWKNLFTASSSQGFSPFINNTKQNVGSKSSNILFGEPTRGDDESNAAYQVFKDSKSGWVAGASDCKNEFIVINFINEKEVGKAKIYPRKDFPNNNQYIKEFAVQTAKQDGIFHDLGYKFKTDFSVPWIKDGNIIFIKNYNNKFIRILPNGSIIESDSSDLSSLLESEKFQVIKNKDDTISLKTTNGTLLKPDKNKMYITQSDLHDSPELDDDMNEERFRIEETENGKVALKTIYDTYMKYEKNTLVQSQPSKKLPSSWEAEKFTIGSIEESENNNFFEFNVNRRLKYLKIIPLKSNLGCAMRISVYGKNSEVDLIETLINTKGISPKSSSCFNHKNGEVSKLTDGEICTYGGYESSKLDRYSGGGWSAGQLDKVDKNMFVLIDTGREQCIKGGIVYTRDNYDDKDCSSCDHYVKKFKVFIAGNNKVFSYLGTFRTHFKGNSPGKNEGFKFNINKFNVRYVKVVILECNKHCSMRLDIY